MKKEIKETVTVTMLALGLLVTPAFADSPGTTQSQQQMNNNMMSGGQGSGMKNQGMMGGGQGSGMMNRGMMGGAQGSGMMNRGMMGGGQGGNWGGMGCNGMMGGAMMNRMTPEQQNVFLDQTTDLRKQMMDLSFDYRDAMRNPDTSLEDLGKIEKKMLELRTKMIDQMGNMQTK